jgi:hypothetical protein
MRRPFLLLLVALALVAGACSGGDEKKVEATSKRTTTTAESADHDPALTLDGTTTSVAGSSRTTLKGATATTTKGSGSGATTPAPTASANNAPGPAKAGTYDYAQSGTTSQPGEQANKPVPPDGTLTVSGAAADQTFRRTFDSDGDPPPSDIHFAFRSDGPFITKVVARYAFFEIVCTFGTPVPAPPWPADTGKKFSGHATCTNGFQADFTGSVTGRTTSNVGGSSVEAVIVKSNLHVYDGNIDLKIDDTQHWAPSLSLPTYSNEVVNGSAFGSTITANITSKLKSVNPR